VCFQLSAACLAGKRGFKNLAQDFACVVLVVEIASIREATPPDVTDAAVGRPGEFVSIRDEGSQLHTFQVATVEAP
jgi:hypothetical protein